MVAFVAFNALFSFYQVDYSKLSNIASRFGWSVEDNVGISKNFANAPPRMATGNLAFVGEYNSISSSTGCKYTSPNRSYNGGSSCFLMFYTICQHDHLLTPIFAVFLALKNTPLAILTAYSYERLNSLHQIAGYTTLLYTILRK